MYPLSDSTSSDIQKVLFKPGIVSFNEDYNSIETNRELEDIIRFNSISKVCGIASESRSNDNTYLFPTPIVSNQISISAGTGYTRNGARITVPSPLSIIDITTLPNYVVPSITKKVYLVLRKVSEEYQNRSHPITGVATKTRQRIKTDNSIVEFYVYDSSVITDSSIPIINDNDVIVLARLNTVGPITFDITEKTGFRKIIRTTEDKALEVSGGDMEGNINMQNLYNIMNTPQWGKNKFSLEGTPHNRDFIRLFSRINYTLALLRGIKFGESTNNWGILFENSFSIKMSLIPNQRPPKKINIVNNGTFISIPTNHVLYLQLNDTDVLLTSGNQANLELDSELINGTFITENYLNTTNLGTISNSSLLRFPLCYHHVDTITNERKLVFANGMILSYGEEIDNAGKYSGYVRRDGGNIMIGDLTIQKNDSNLILRRSSTVTTSGNESGIVWQSFNGGITSGKLYRIDSLIDTDSVTKTVGDIYLDVYDNDGNQSKQFKFLLDGRLVVPTAPQLDTDVVRFLELKTKVSLSGEPQFIDSDLIFINGHNLTIRDNNPTMVLQDTTSSTTYQSYSMKSIGGGLLGRMIRYSGDPFNEGYNNGDLVIESFSNGEDSPMRITMRRTSNTLEIPKLHTLSDGTIDGNLSIGKQVIGNKTISIKNLPSNAGLDLTDVDRDIYSSIFPITDTTSGLQLRVYGKGKQVGGSQFYEVHNLINKSGTSELLSTTSDLVPTVGSHTFLTMNIDSSLVTDSSKILLSGIINYRITIAGGGNNQTVFALLSPYDKILQKIHLESSSSNGNERSGTLSFNTIVKLYSSLEPLYGTYKLQLYSVSGTLGGDVSNLYIVGDVNADGRGIETQMSYVIL